MRGRAPQASHGLYGRFEGRHLIVFRDSGDPVQIVRVLHHRMDPVGHPEG